MSKVGKLPVAIPAGVTVNVADGVISVKGPKGELKQSFHNEIDIKNPETNHKNAGFSDEEREKMTQLLAAGFCDTFRTLYPKEVKYSWWSYRFKARERNTGWRIDYFLVSERIMDKVTEAGIHNDVGTDALTLYREVVHTCHHQFTAIKIVMPSYRRFVGKPREIGIIGINLLDFEKFAESVIRDGIGEMQLSSL